jgi:hypothetical protein
MESWLSDSEVHQFLQVNRYQEALWFNQEAFEELLWWMFLLAAVNISADPLRPESEVSQETVASYEVIQRLLRAEGQSEYQIEKLLAALRR